jgi:hypothetical protein
MGAPLRTLAVLASFALVAVAAGPIEEAELSPTCQDLRPIVGGGRGDLLGLYGEASLRCRPMPALTVQLGLRYTEQRRNVSSFLVLSYDWPLGPGWWLNAKASVRERAGDYEIDRTPEITLRWVPAAPGALLLPAVDLSAGSISVHLPRNSATRVGAILSVSTRQVAFGPSGVVWGDVRLGSYSYGSGQNHNFWSGSVSLGVRPSAATEAVLTFFRSEGFGVSPLAFDNVGLDEVVTGRLSFQMSPTLTLSAGSTIALLAQPVAVREHFVTLTKVGAWTVGVTYRLSDGRLLFTAALLQ